jgi:hypothetical protein
LATLAIKTLNVLKHPIEPALGKKSLAMMTWGIDFTDDMGDFALNAGSWRFQDRVEARMAELGFPNWPRPPYWTLTAVPTSQVPLANQEFEYVIVQKDIVLADHIGDGYIHFNR